MIREQTVTNEIPLISLMSHLCSVVLPCSVELYIRHRYELKWIRGKCERLAISGVFRSASQICTIGHMIQCFKNASQLYMLD